MSEQITVAIDAMGGDFGPEVTLPAAQQVLKKHNNLSLILTGDSERLQSAAAQLNIPLNDRLSIHHASQVVEMHDDPRLAIRKKKDSSMRVAIDLLHEGKAQAVVSAGNTGALVGMAKFVLKTVPGIDRPAICTTIPAVHGHTHMLDLGANVDCTADHLFQFAVMGSVLAEAIDNVAEPRIGLLNIGHEEGKGNALVKEANGYPQNAPVNYIGYVEGDDIYFGDVDVIVCDGFIGNISLKTSEGVAKLISHFMKQEFTRSWRNMLRGLVARRVLRSFRDRIDPRAYNGASLLGLNGIVIKSHGGTDVFGYANAIEIAVVEIEKAVPAHIRTRMEPLLEKAS